MGDELELDVHSAIEFEGEKSIEAGFVVGHPIDTIFIRFNFPDIDNTLQIIFTEIEALAVIHMLSGVLLTTLSDQVDDDRSPDDTLDRGNNGPAELGQGNTQGSPTTND